MEGQSASEREQLAIQFYDNHSHNNNISNEHRQQFSGYFSDLIGGQKDERRSELINLAVYFANKDDLSDYEIAQRVCAHVGNLEASGPKV